MADNNVNKLVIEAQVEPTPPAEGLQPQPRNQPPPVEGLQPLPQRQTPPLLKHQT